MLFGDYVFAAKFLFQLGIVLRTSWYHHPVNNILGSSLLHGEITHSFRRGCTAVDLGLIDLLVVKHFWGFTSELLLHDMSFIPRYNTGKS